MMEGGQKSQNTSPSKLTPTASFCSWLLFHAGLQSDLPGKCFYASRALLCACCNLVLAGRSFSPEATNQTCIRVWKHHMSDAIN